MNNNTVTFNSKIINIIILTYMVKTWRKINVKWRCEIQQCIFKRKEILSDSPHGVFK